MRTSCSISMTELAKDDFANLPQDIKQECFDMLKNLQANLHLGKKLGNNGIRDLSDCYKLYFHNAEYRIIYMKKEDTISVEGITPIVEKIAEVVGIGQRADYKIYDEIAKRLGRFINNNE